MAKEKEEISFVAKLSIKTLGCVPLDAVKQGKEVSLCRIFGVAQGVKYVPNKQTGDVSVALIGDFEGVNLTTGETLRSGVCYLPSGIHDKISAPLEAARRSETAADPIQFGVELCSFPSSNPGGYSYKAKPFFQTEAFDPLAEIRKAMLGLPVQPKKAIAPPAAGGKKAAA